MQSLPVQTLAGCRPRLSRRCQPECAERFAGVGIVQCIVRRTLNRNGGGWAWETWSCIAYRESKWIPTATGAAGERGIFQIHPIHQAWLSDERWAMLYDPEVNTLTAVELYHRAGDSFDPWTTRGGC